MDKGIAPSGEWLPEISSDFAILDVTKGRDELNRLLIRRHNSQKPMRVRLLIEADVDWAWGGDDGISREFSLDIVNMRWKP